MQTMIGVIGGSGVYQIDGLEGASWVKVKTPWGKPSDEVLLGRLDGIPMAFLPRHGRGHVQTPSSINYRANIRALAGKQGMQQTLQMVREFRTGNQSTPQPRQGSVPGARPRHIAPDTGHLCISQACQQGKVGTDAGLARDGQGQQGLATGIRIPH